jgi:2-amino-4-hydroxy-6-hydroxymethyldihydropteridine diphosphokinase
MTVIYLGLGTNLGDRRANLAAAIDALGPMVAGLRLSSVWETAPLYVTDQPAFLNMAAMGACALAPLEMLDRLKELEDRLGRVASVRYGPRLIDLDILVMDGVMLDIDRLTVPHPRLAERRFALAPLVELAPDLVPPGWQHSVAQVLAQLGDADPIARLGPL